MPAASQRTLLLLLFIASGSTGLVYELVWTRQLTFVFGGTTYAITTVLVAFMAGLGLGCYLAGRLSARLAEPGRWYGLLELFIGLYALAVPLLLHLAEPIYRTLYPHIASAGWLLTTVRFLLSAATLILPTTAMGATLPLLVQFVTRGGGPAGLAVGLLYGINTLGAVAGTLATGFWLIPTLGLLRTTWAAAALNLIIGTIALLVLRIGGTAPAPHATRAASHKPRPQPRTQSAAPPPEQAPLPRDERTLVLIACGISGFAAMVYQIMWTRVLIMSVGSSTYSFTCILAAFILGLALGSLAVARWVDRWRNLLLAAGVIELAIGLSATIVAPIYGKIPFLVHDLIQQHRSSYGRLLSLEFVMIIAVTLAPTLLMGALFPVAACAVSRGHADAGAATGRIYGVNTLGTIFGSFLAGFVLIRREILGIQNSIIIASVLNALIGAWLIYRSRRDAPAGALRIAAAAGGPVLIALLAAVGGRWQPEVFAAGAFLPGTDPAKWRTNSRVIFFAEGVDLTVAVACDKPVAGDTPELARQREDFRSLSVNGKTDASTGLPDMTTQLLLGHLPVLLSPDARSACVIGLGSGMTVAAIARHPQFERIDCVELSEEVIAAANWFAPFNHNVLTDEPRLQMHRADGRNHLLLHEQTYDLIVSEPSNPWIAGVGNLFTLEFFQLCDRCLSTDGRACIWTHGYMMSEENFRLIVRTAARVFPFLTIWELSENDYAIIVGRRPFALPLARVAERFAAPAVREDLYRVGRGTLPRVLGHFVTSGRPLVDWAGPGVAHTDDNAILEFAAPRFVYGEQELQISHGLDRLARSIFDEVVTIDPADATQAALAERITRASQAERMRNRSLYVADTSDMRVGLKLMIDAQRLDPGNPSVWRHLHETVQVLRQAKPPIAEQPEGRELLEGFVNMRLPTGTPPRGLTLSEIATMLREQAVTRAEIGDWTLALDYLREAYDVDPTLPEVVIDLAFALIRTSQPDEAIERLKAAIAAGNVSRETLADEPRLATLRDDPRFQALLATPRP